MVEIQGMPGLYITLPAYFLVLLVCAIWANHCNRKEVNRHISPLSGRVGDQGYSEVQAMTTDTLSSHYLGGRAMGHVLTTGTIFASFFSGYTIVGIPNEAFHNGWMALRWVAGALMILVGYFGTGLRFRKAALVRNHKTPLDFITDRFQCQILRYTVLILQLVPSVFYIAAQVVALKTTFNPIFGLDINSPYPILVVMTITLMLEWIGGLRCVAMTDCIQGAVMVISYACLPIIIVIHFGGWRELSSGTYPRPEYYQTPTLDMQWNFWQYTMSTFSLFTFPHLMQRTYAAGSLKSLKYAYTSMVIGVWFLQVGAVYIGTMAVEMLRDCDHEVTSPFSEVLEMVINLGGFPKVVGLFTVTATLAAIMSTADSLLVAISQLITEEVVYPINPNATPMAMSSVGRAASFVTILVASLMGLAWENGVTDIGALNFQLSLQSVLIFIIGLFGTERFDCHPWSLAASAILATIYVFSMYYGYLSSIDAPPPMNAGVSAFGCQIVMVAIFEGGRRTLFEPQHEREACECCRDSELLFPHRPDWDIPRRSRFGEKPLTPTLLWKMMKGTNEPLANPWFATVMFLSISYTTPWVTPSFPTSSEDIANSAINGIPWWAVKILVTCAFPGFFLICLIYNMPQSFPSPQPSSTRDPRFDGNIEISDPEIIEMTPEELGHRVVYDQRNDLVYRRRRQILEKLGISPTEIDSIVQSTQEQLQDFEPPF